MGLWRVARALAGLARVVGWDTLIRGERVDLRMPRGHRRLTDTATASEAQVLTFRPNSASERFSDLCRVALDCAQRPRGSSLPPPGALDVWLRVGSSATDVEVLAGRDTVMGWTSLAEHEYARMRSLAQQHVYPDGVLAVEQAGSGVRSRLRVALPC